MSENSAVNKLKISGSRTESFSALVLVLILVFSVGFPLLCQESAVVNAQPISTVPSDMLEYEWLGVNRDVAQTHFSAGPAPDLPVLKWQKSVPGMGSDPVLFNGMLFITQGSSIVAMDPETGDVIYTTNVPKVLPDRSASASAILKIDDKYMVAMSATSSIVNETVALPAAWALRGFRINDGSLIWTMPAQYGPTTAYRPRYVPETEMLYMAVGNSTGRGGTQNPGGVQAWSLPDPTQPPTQAWTWINFGVTYGVGSIIYGDGRLFVGGSEPHQTCLNATTGDVLWETQLTGSIQYGGTYYNGVVYRGLLDNTFVAIDGATGEVLWTNRPTAYGFWASATAAAYGLVYETNVDGYFYAFNATTGDIVWKYLGPGQYYPGYPEIADGKVYVCTGQGVPSPLTGQGVSEFTCFNASTGEVLWQINKEFRSGPSDYQAIAYGNFYGVNQETENGLSTYNSPPPKVLDTILYCYGGNVTLQDWAMFGSDPVHSAVGVVGPTTMSEEWTYYTGGAVVSSPVIVQGKLYIGSDDHNWYCLDAQSGAKIWNFTVGYYIRSTAAVVDGLVYTGSDDGNVYCLDAATGALQWETPTPGEVLPIMTGTYPEYHSSPVVVAGKVYVGSMDGQLYCLDAATGAVDWTVQTSGAILSTPTYVEGDGLYFASVDGFVYKVNPASGGLIWNVSTPIGLEIALEGTPCVGGGLVVIGSGAAHNAPAYLGQMYCFNASTGDSVWTYTQQTYNTTGPNLQPIWTPLYLDHPTLGPVFYFGDFFHFTCVNASDGSVIWTTYLTREHFGLPAYANNLLYMPADTFGIYVVDATNGVKLAFFDVGGQVRSSPALYDGKVYFGSNNWGVYCVGQSSSGTTYYGSSPSSASPLAVVLPTSAPLAIGSSPAPAPTQGVSVSMYAVSVGVVLIVLVALVAILLRKRT